MEPRIQYAQTKDGVSIAFSTLGERGPALVCFPPLTFSNIALEWEIPGLREWYERLASSRMLVRFDARGQGRSQRGVEDYSRDALMSDLEAVVDRLRLERLDLLAFDGPAQMAIAFAARHTKSVSRLVLWGAEVHNRDAFGGWDRLQALLALAERDWDLAVESWTHAALGWARGQVAHQWAQYIRASIEQEDFLRIWRHIPGFDATPLLSQVAARTLVIEPSPSRRSSALSHHSAVLASNIPDAQVVRLSPGSAAAYEHEEGMRLAEDFLRPEESAREIALPEGITAILFADIVDSTALTEEMGDAAFRAKARDLDMSLRAIIRECAGTPVEGKVLGDGVLAVFTSARQAIECALRCDAASEPLGLRLHLGIHAGDVIREDDPDGRANVYGGAVNIAARIAGASAPGEVLVSDTVRGLARTSAGVTFEERGERTLKGIADPQHLFAVRART